MTHRLDSMLSKGMGTVKRAQARLGGLVGVFQTLASQHGEVKVLLERGKTADTAKRMEMWPIIRRELISHERAETTEVYPVLHAHVETRALAEHHDAEARQLEALIEQIDGTGIGTAAFGDLFARLVDTVVQHAKEEETQVFPQAQRVLGKDRAKELERRFLDAKRRIAQAE